MSLLEEKVVSENQTYFSLDELKTIDDKSIIKFFLAFAYSESKDVGYLVEVENSLLNIEGHQINNLIFRGK